MECFWKAPPGQCNTTVIWRCLDPINQWQCSFNLRAVMPLVKRLATLSDSSSNTGFSPTSCPSVQHYSLFCPTRCRQWKHKSVHRKKCRFCIRTHHVCSTHRATYMRQWIQSALVQIMACRLVGAIILTDAWILLIRILRPIVSEANLKRNSSIFTHQYVFETVVCETVAVSPRPQCAYRIIQDLEMPCNVDME